jgi:hypothetical protein
LWPNGLILIIIIQAVAVILLSPFVFAGNLQTSASLSAPRPPVHHSLHEFYTKASVPSGEVFDLSRDAGKQKEVAMKETRRLMQERADLINTGVYHKGDRVIKELDRRVAALQAC